MTDIRCIEDMVVYFQRVLKAREEKDDKEKKRRKKGREREESKFREEGLKRKRGQAAGALDPAGRTAVGRRESPCAFMYDDDYPAKYSIVKYNQLCL